MSLAFPASLSDRAAGITDSWGAGTVWLDMPGGPYRITGLSARQLRWVGDRYKGSLIKNHSAKVAAPTLRMVYAPAPPIESVVIGGVHTPTLAHSTAGVHTTGLGYTAHLPSNLHDEVRVGIESDTDGNTASALDNVLRMLVSYRMLEIGGVVLHSAGIIVDGGVWIFYGVSGSGKSTLSRLALEAGHEVLSDDLNAVITPSGLPTVRAVPFSGELAQVWRGNSSYPLKGLFRLRKGSSIRVSEFTPAVAVGAMAVCCPYANSKPALNKSLLDTLAGLIPMVPAGEVTFARDSDFSSLAAALRANS